MCVCVCVCVRARARACMFVRAYVCFGEHTRVRCTGENSLLVAIIVRPNADQRAAGVMVIIVNGLEIALTSGLALSANQ